MNRSKKQMRRLLLQPLEGRCMMDASGFDVAIDAGQGSDAEVIGQIADSMDTVPGQVDFEMPNVIMPFVPYHDSEIQSTDTEELVSVDAVDVGVGEVETTVADDSGLELDMDAIKRMYDSFVPTPGDEGGDAPPLVICNLRPADFTLDGSENDLVAFAFDSDVDGSSESDGSDGLLPVDPPNAYFGELFSATDELMQANSAEDSGSEFWLDIDQNGLVSVVDAWMIINSINSTNGLTGSPEFDVNGDSLVSPLDVLIVINQLNIAQAGANGFAAPAVSSSRLAARVNPASIVASGDLTESSSMPLIDDSHVDESSDQSTSLIDSAMADLGDTTDDALLFTSIMPNTKHKIFVPQDEDLNVDLSGDVAIDGEFIEPEVNAPNMFA